MVVVNAKAGASKSLFPVTGFLAPTPPRFAKSGTYKTTERVRRAKSHHFRKGSPFSLAESRALKGHLMVIEEMPPVSNVTGSHPLPLPPPNQEINAPIDHHLRKIQVFGICK
jgi:hypothetical protein